MTSFHSKDLAQMTPPDIIAELDYETLLGQRKQELNALFPILFNDSKQPVIAPAELIEEETETYWKVPLDKNAGLYYLNLESEPLLRLLQADVYREMLLRYQFNHFALGLMPAYATGTTLDHLASRDNVTRLELSPIDNTTTPPTPAVYESDDDFRRRWLQTRESKAVGGSEGWYVTNTLSADPQVKDAKATSPGGSQVVITVLSREGNGTADGVLIDAVEAAIRSQYTHVISDELTVQSAIVTEYALTANITYYSGSSSALVKQKIEQEFAKYREKTERMGHSVTESGIMSVLHQQGVYKVVVVSPAVLPIEIPENGAAFCTGLTLIDEGTY